VSSARLERTAAAKFGRAGADRVAQALVLPTAASRGKDLLENVADADVAVRDDRATVEIEPVGSIELRRVEGRWGIYVADSDVDAGRDDTNLLKALTAAQEQVATRIESGQVTTVEEAARAIGAVAEDAGRAAGREPQAPGPDPGN
jgi:hypothetical protein